MLGKENSMIRKYHLQQIQEILQSINEAQSSGHYSDCQEGAYSICDFIDNVVGEGTATVELLEKYCELLFKAHNNETNIKHLKKHMIKVENSIKRELKPRPEIAFLSYKASMSDSIESIYLAAKEDPDCDAYFIPIPYYDRNADGSLGQMHYEGADCYSDRIEITDWEAYNIEERRPDAIFTFNPYDDGNFVTSVHPSFYCKNLRNLTDLLVYVPYFVAGEDITPHFTTLPGCVYSHKIIVQSEKTREKYIKGFKDVYENKLGKPEDKFVALGSPKFDKVINSDRNDFPLPDEWRNLIGDKKVIFYNSSIAAILEGKEQYLVRMHKILKSFQNRDDVVLWWRPHPLNKATYQSIRPRLLDEYMQTIDQYKNDAWGIYDDTADLHRAIAWSDAYYGDWSSVAVLYEPIDKAIMITNNSQYFTPYFMCASEHGIWFTTGFVNGLFKANDLYSKLERVGTFPNKTNGVPFETFGYPSENNGIIYFPPNMGSEIMSYSINDNTFEIIQYDSDAEHKCIENPFYETIVYKQYVLFTPFNYPGIIRFDTETKQINCYDNWLEPLNKLISDEVEQDGFFISTSLQGNILYLASSRINAVLEFNVDTGESVIHKVGQKDYRYQAICFDGENYWLTPRRQTNTPMIKWNPKDGTCKEIHIFPSSNFLREGFLPGFYCHGHIWLMPSSSERPLKINIHTNDVSIAQELESNLNHNETQSLSSYTFKRRVVSGNNVYSVNTQTKSLVEFNLETMELRETTFDDCVNEDEKIDFFISKAFCRNAYNKKTQENYISQHSANPKENSGNLIFGYVKKEILG